MERYRIWEDGAVFFVTYSVVEWLPVFISEAICRVITDSFRFCHVHRGLRVNAYVIMPTQLHAIVFDAQFCAGRLQQTLDNLRKFTGRRLSDQVDRCLPACFGQVLRQAAGTDRQRRFWQPSRHPVLLESDWFWQQKFDYLHLNPCRKGLVRHAADWRFSSASFWMSDGQITNDVPLSALPW